MLFKVGKLYTILKESKNKFINVYSADTPVFAIFVIITMAALDRVRIKLTYNGLPQPGNKCRVNKSTYPFIIHGKESVAELFYNIVHSAILLF